MSLPRRILLASATLLLLSAPVGAIELKETGPSIHLDITESLFVEYHSTLDDAALTPSPEHIATLANKLDLRLRIDPRLRSGGWRIGAFLVGLRVDLAVFPNPPSSLYQHDVRPEVIFVKGSARHKTLGRIGWVIGDDYISLGRGMALSLRKVDDLGFDMTLRGGHFTWQHKYVTARVSAGVTNVVNVDTVGRKRVPDPNDLIFAGRVEARPTRWMRVGVHGVDIERRDSEAYQALSPMIWDGAILADNGENPASPDPTEYIRSTVFGGNLEFTNLADVLSIYLEGNGMISSTAVAGIPLDDQVGYALYGAVTGYAGPVTILAEVKHYEDFALTSTPHGRPGLEPPFTYIVAPTLERYDQRVQQNTDVTGAHLRLDFRIPDTKDTLFISGAWFNDAPIADEMTYHVYGGWEHRTDDGDRWIAQYGHRYEGGEAPGPIRLRMFHLDLDLYLQLDGPHDLQFHWAHEFRSEDIGTSLEDEYLEGTTYLTWNFSPHWSFTAQLEYKTDRDTDMPVFPGAHVMYRFTDDTFVRVFGGRMKGGLKCAGGICRIFPDFEGVRLDATMRF